MQEIHPIDLLFNKLKDISPYPDGVIPVPKRLEGAGFFQVLRGCGLSSPTALFLLCPLEG
jgi:hypothetical protein